MIQDAVAAPVVAEKRKGLSRRQRRTLAFYGFIAPWLILFVLLGAIPLILGLLTSTDKLRWPELF